MALESRPLVLRRVAGANADSGQARRDSPSLRHVRDTGERRTEIALDVGGERLQRANVDHAAALDGPCRVRGSSIAKHQLVETPEESGQRLAGARRRQNQR